MRSTLFWSYQLGGFTDHAVQSSSPRRYVFESGGRPNGTAASSPTSTTRSRYPSPPSVTARCQPPMPLPIITVPELVMSRRDVGTESRCAWMSSGQGILLTLRPALVHRRLPRDRG